ncbi:serine hydrolase [Micromonospora pisi]|uniref:serine hydrolase n=1 Tax=Micromonospora pisi TaxID=589240 RepID=UPI0011C4385D|nr:serine hydrolase [Micromonospora pisi]
MILRFDVRARGGFHQPDSRRVPDRRAAWSRRPLTAMVGLMLAVLPVAGCGGGDDAAAGGGDAAAAGGAVAGWGSAAGTTGVPSPAPGPGGASASPSGPAGCRPVNGWDCTWQKRFATVSELVGKKPGSLGVELRDRRTGAVWRVGATTHLYWTGSTIKLAMVTSVLERARAGEVTLTDADRKNIADMLAFSSDEAADEIWNKFGRDTMVGRFTSRYGMSKLAFAGSARYWGFMKCTPADLAALMSYVLKTLDPKDRSYLVGAMRDTDPIQHWGVWAAGANQQPGNKNGWSVETDNGKDHWLTSSVGFVGPDQRYVLAMMYDMPAGQDSLKLGGQTLSDIAAVLFGAKTPAQVVVRPS